MNQKYLYLLINIFTIAVPLAVSFHSKANFSRKWTFVMPAILINATLFIIWDEIFTQLGVWGFNEKYVSGIYLSNVPLEEILFFVCIPYACMFTNFALTKLIEKDYLFPHHEIISSIIVVVSLVVGIYNIEKLYTASVLLFNGLFLAWHMLKVRPRYMGRFYLTFLILLIPFMIVNGILTGSFLEEPIVWYNNEENLGVRIGTIPIEDFSYAMLMLLMLTTIAEWLEERSYYKKKSPDRSRLSNIFK